MLSAICASSSTTPAIRPMPGRTVLNPLAGSIASVRNRSVDFDTKHSCWSFVKRTLALLLRKVLIARDQTRKANATLAVIWQRSLGITKGIWQHTGAGQHPRADHVAASGREFDLAKECLISGEYLLPGQKINCGCIWRPVLPFQD